MKYWKTGGIVDSVNEEDGTITLFIRSFNELKTIKISPDMPKWLLHSNVAFRAEIPKICLKDCTYPLLLKKIEKQEFGHLTEEELYNEFNKLFGV